VCSDKNFTVLFCIWEGGGILNAIAFAEQLAQVGPSLNFSYLLFNQNKNLKYNCFIL
jgi:hypothetical protein